jgi:hypothetical protein
MLPWWAWAIAACWRSRAALVAENLCLRQQLLVLRRRQLWPRHRQRSTFLDLGEPMVPGLARHPPRRECGHGGALAPSRLEWKDHCNTGARRSPSCLSAGRLTCCIKFLRPTAAFGWPQPFPASRKGG